MIWKVQIYHLHTVDNIMGLYSKGQLSNQSCSCWVKNALASEGPNRDPIATPSICLHGILLKTKYDSLVAKDRTSLNSLFFKLWTMLK